MTVKTRQLALRDGDHAVQFYAHEAELFDTAGGYLTEAIGAGAVAIAIATEEHRRGFDRALRVGGIDPDEAARAGTYIPLDAAGTLASFTLNGEINLIRFREVIGGLIRDASASGRPVCAYGEMVALLWAAGDVLGAIELERLWNELAGDHDFALLCAYPSADVEGQEHADALNQVCHLHSSVVPLSELEVEVERQFGTASTAPHEARRFIAGALRQAGHRGQLLDDAQLVTSELATNVLLHGHTPFTVSATIAGSRIRIEVKDESLAQPQIPAQPKPSSGHGLRIVSEIATDWGVAPEPNGKTVWAELHR